jgi:hypothetical protein
LANLAKLDELENKKEDKKKKKSSGFGDAVASTEKIRTWVIKLTNTYTFPYRKNILLKYRTCASNSKHNCTPMTITTFMA